MNYKSLLESLLFTAGHPVTVKKLAEILETGEIEINGSLKELVDDYEKNERGLRLVFFDGKVQLVASPYSVEPVKKLIKSDFEEDLSPAALETLAIISYRGPISRAQIENLRGVNCSFILQSLAIRGLIGKYNNPEDGRSYIYNITFDFLKHLGLNKLEDLPNYMNLRDEANTK
ncbi:SMC-Scp complex subunit ScpB [Candidatus Azambacteria bacterium RIFOXYD1_FULL_42_11]|uniref:Segregation and condensation protein B n=3 Tax=Candidatus Azamiibacteriota TaxID=1752741 RepID=A0A0G0ZD46_9BACT|nr:MAG: Segregation and condensation protein B [Candidatus Azambacteria bacterium GW2011_GWA1_42_19]KKS75830.1 MAG: Segregation and condensation protein B [Candidatus Azambacteria bacterium GW2011_GWA2_42_9]KKS88941.1 MAG: Segregation and condensation protein B [Parcubacteria group bacterium GW2011_GWC1_43_11]OGD41790.1 MAG: SMC-Scp complex subunit ScpB [Candidatus Azambacteria bacterium RIFOXYD1_FULL_42_11]